MIKKIEIFNFQSHKNSILEFTPGLNIINGPSHNGKSAIIRALKWCLQNKPRGDSFKSHFANKKDPVKVSITFDNGVVVTREKGKENIYRITKNNSETEYKALGVDVPNEVQEVINMNNINLQSQGDNHFMVSDRPGARAKALNKIVGLEVIDSSIKKSNAVVNKYKSSLSLLTDEIKSNTESLKQFDNVENIEKLIKFIDFKYATLATTRTAESSLVDLIEKIEKTEKEIETVTYWLDVEYEFNKVNKQLKEINRIKSEKKQLSKLIDEILVNQNTISDNKDFLNIENEMLNIENLLEQLKIKNSKIFNIQNLISDISYQISFKRVCEKIIKQSIMELNKIGACPVCGQEIKEWRI
jgi:exonuclease SbcC